MPNPERATHARIHCDYLRSNLAAIRGSIPEGTLICAALKANAYGHGAGPVSRIMRQEGVEILGVSSPSEGEELRRLGDKGRILVYGPSVPEEVPVTLDAALETMISDAVFLEVLEHALKSRPASFRLPVHLKIDTGMGRIGCRPSEALTLARRMAGNPQMELAGLATHFPSADSDAPEDMEFTRHQTGVLESVSQQLRHNDINPGLVHAANSGAMALSPGSALNMVRPGIALYGYGKNIGMDKLKPVMELVTRITAIKKVFPGESVSYGRTWRAERETWIATVPAGYADGYRRALSNKGEVLIGKRCYPVAGTVCMDQMMVNLGPQTTINLYDEVTLFGADSRGPSAEDLAEVSSTISYEILCGISARVPRIYL